MGKKFFTVEEARQLLPSIQKLMDGVMEISSRLKSFQEALEELAASASSNSGSPEGTAYVHQLLLVQKCLHHIQESGCLVKSVQEGLVDFPHLKDGREVYLCWKYGEEGIHFWHEVGEGFAGRVPLLE